MVTMLTEAIPDEEILGGSFRAQGQHRG